MTSTPHDALAKLVLGDPGRARALLSQVLPPALAPHVVWSELRAEHGSFVDPTLSARHSDLVFTMPLAGGRDALLYVLLEHQSEPDPLMPVRMLVYIARLYDALLRARPEARSVPLVVPVVLHHGQGGWTAPRRLGEVLDAGAAVVSAVGPVGPALELLVDDLATLDDEALGARAADAFALLALHLLRDARGDVSLLELVRRVAAPMRSLAEAPTGRDALTAMLRYLALVRREGPDELRAVIDVLGEELAGAKEVVMNLAENLKNEGRAEGRVEIVLKLLALRFGALSAATEARVRSAGADELDRMAERVLSAVSLSDVIG